MFLVVRLHGQAPQRVSVGGDLAEILASRWRAEDSQEPIR